MSLGTWHSDWVSPSADVSIAAILTFLPPQLQSQPAGGVVQEERVGRGQRAR